jgi:hypothetical protein
MLVCFLTFYRFIAPTPVRTFSQGVLLRFIFQQPSLLC